MPSPSPSTPCPTCGYAVTGKRCPECGKLLRASIVRAEGLRDRRLISSAFLTVVPACVCALLIFLPFYAGGFGLHALAGPYRGSTLNLWLLAILGTFALYAVALLFLCIRIASSLFAPHEQPTAGGIIIAMTMYIVILLFTGAAAAFFTLGPQLAG